MASMEEGRTVYRIEATVRPGRKRPVVRAGCRWADNDSGLGVTAERVRWRG